MKRYLLGSATVVICAGVLATAQVPPADPGQQRPATTPADPSNPDQRGQVVTLVGCLYQEKDVPGRQPNVAEQAGVLEDYILADARPASKSGEAGATGTTGQPDADPGRGHEAGAPGVPKMFKVEQLPDDQLRPLVGKRVEVTGRIDAEEDDTTGGAGRPAAGEDRSLGPDDIELPEFEATSIREVSGNCPAKPQR